MNFSTSLFEQRLSQQLAALSDKKLRRQLRCIESVSGTYLQVEGRNVCNFSSSDYLGLTDHPALCEAAAVAALRFGSGATASRLVCGTTLEHTLLEEALAAATKTEAALLFSTGYVAATGALPVLMERGDVILLDKLAHASLIDGARASKATLRIFRHNDLTQLEEQLLWARQHAPRGVIMIVTESIFSMEGDAAPLQEIVALKEKYGALLFLDEAHAIGVRGLPGQRMGGLAGELGLTARIDIQMGTLSKAVGVSGGYIAASRIIIETLLNRARSFIYSTAPTPATAAAARAAIAIINSSEGEQRAMKLWKNIQQLHDAFAVLGKNRPFLKPASAIIPLILGDEEAALSAAHQLWEAGYFVPAIRYPSVARGKALLRIALNAHHTNEEISKFMEQIAEIEGHTHHE